MRSCWRAGSVDRWRSLGLHCSTIGLGERIRKPARIRHGPATLTGERTLSDKPLLPMELKASPKRRGGPGGAGIRESGDWAFARQILPGRGPREGGLYAEKLYRVAHLVGRDAPLELVGGGAPIAAALLPALGQRGVACSVARAGGRGNQLPARVRPRWAAPTRRSLPLKGQDNDRVLSAPRDGGRVALRSPGGALRLSLRRAVRGKCDPTRTGRRRPGRRDLRPLDPEDRSLLRHRPLRGDRRRIVRARIRLLPRPPVVR